MALSFGFEFLSSSICAAGMPALFGRYRYAGVPQIQVWHRFSALCDIV